MSRRAVAEWLSTTAPRHWGVVCAVLASVLLAHWPEVSGWLSSDPMMFVARVAAVPAESVLPGAPGWNDPNVGQTIQALGGLAAEQWLHGRLPWWNPYSGVGLPLAAELQNGAWFLPFVLLEHFANGPFWEKVCLQALAAFGCFALLRQLQLGRLPAAMGGICFGLNGTFAWMGDAPIMPIAFLPLLLLGIERAAERARSGQPGGWRLTALALAWSLLAGFPETAYLQGLLAAAWTVLRAWQAPPAVRGAVLRKIALGGGLGVLLALPAILPFLTSLSRSYIGPHTGVDAAFASAGFGLMLLPYALGNPYYHGQWLLFGNTGGYFQLGLVLAALLGLSRRGRDAQLRWLLAAFLSLMLLRASGVPLLTPLLNVVPMLSIIIVPRYVWPPLELAVAVLGAMAVQDWIDGVRFGWARIALVIGLCLTGIAGGLAASADTVRWLLHQETYYPAFLGGSIGFAVLVLAVGCGVALRPVTARRARLAGVLLAGEAVALASLPTLSGSRPVPMDTASLAFLRQNLGLQRTITLGPMRANYGARFGIAALNYDYLPAPMLWVNYIRTNLFPGAYPGVLLPDWPPARPGQDGPLEAFLHRIPAYEALGVKYVLAQPGSAPFAAIAPPPALVHRGAAMDIYELPSPAPYMETRGGPCVLAVPDRESASADCAAPATLIRRELALSGWTARIDGVAAEVRRDNRLFQSVALPAGRSEVRFRYAPPYAGWAWLGCLAGLLGLLAPRRWLPGRYLPETNRSSQ